MSPEQEYLDRVTRFEARRAADSWRGTHRARRMEYAVEKTQLTLRAGRQLRILAAGDGAGAGDVGKFWFVVGYSKVGGPDLVPGGMPGIGF